MELAVPLRPLWYRAGPVTTHNSVHHHNAPAERANPLCEQSFELDSACGRLRVRIHLGACHLPNPDQRPSHPTKRLPSLARSSLCALSHWSQPLRFWGTLVDLFARILAPDKCACSPVRGTGAGTRMLPTAPWRPWSFERAPNESPDPPQASPARHRPSLLPGFLRSRTSHLAIAAGTPLLRPEA